MKTLIGERIDEICDKLNLSKADFTRRIGLESNATISRIASGKVNPSYEVLKKIVEGFPEINIAWLLTGEGEMMSGKTTEPQEKKTEPSEREVIQIMKEQIAEQKKMIDFLMEQVRQNRETLSNNHKKTEE